MRLVAVAQYVPAGSLAAEGKQCLCVDVTASGAEPGDELPGSHLCLDGPDALVLQALEILLSSGFPFAESRVPMTVRED